jgi:GTP-binding protein EngB required for normal cell division
VTSPADEAQGGADATPSAALNPSQRGSLSAGLQHIAGLVDEVERILIAAGNPSPFNKIVGDLTPSDAGVVRDYVRRIRDAMLTAAKRHSLDLQGHVVGARKAIDVQALSASITVEEMRSRRLRGYGALDPRAAEEVERTCDELERAIRELQLFIGGGKTEDYAERLTRLTGTTEDPQLLPTLERIIREYGLVEFRALLGSILERMEERSFHIAVFGRVSCGKSSLLNALLGADILPVGVTPVTAVPTRVRSGSPPSLRVRYATGASETIAIDRLPELASEQGNPGNAKRVSRLELVYPVPDLPEGVELVDTPGIGSLATSGAAEAFAYLPRTDLALLLVDVSSSIGSDELGLLRLFKDAAIPVEILMSKADLVDAEGLSKLEGYVRTMVEREAGFVPEVIAVSAREAEHPRVRIWAERHLVPRFARRSELAAESVRRLSGRLLQGVTANLRVRLGRSAEPGETVVGAEPLRAADARIAEVRQALEKTAESSADALSSVLLQGAALALARWKAEESRNLDPAPLVAEALDATARGLREEIVARLSQLHSVLREAAEAVDPVAGELVSARLPGPDLAGLPVLDSTAVVASVGTLGRPLLFEAFPAWAERRVARTLAARFGGALREALRTHGYRLRDFSERAVTRLAEAFHGAVGPFVAIRSMPTAGVSVPDRQRIEGDLSALTAFEQRVRTAV